MGITYTEASQTITAAEHSLPFDAAYAGESDPTTIVLGVILNVSNLVLGDEILLKVYETVGGSILPTYETSIAGPYTTRHFTIPDMTVSAGWNVTLRWISGGERLVTWRLKTVTGADTSATIATAVGARELWTGFSADRVERIIASVVAGLRTADGVFRNLTNTADQVTGTATDGVRTGTSYGA